MHGCALCSPSAMASTFFFLCDLKVLSISGSKGIMFRVLARRIQRQKHTWRKKKIKKIDEIKYNSKLKPRLLCIDIGKNKKKSIPGNGAKNLNGAKLQVHSIIVL